MSQNGSMGNCSWDKIRQIVLKDINCGTIDWGCWTRAWKFCWDPRGLEAYDPTTGIWGGWFESLDGLDLWNRPSPWGQGTFELESYRRIAFLPMLVGRCYLGSRIVSCYSTWVLWKAGRVWNIQCVSLGWRNIRRKITASLYTLSKRCGDKRFTDSIDWFIDRSIIWVSSWLI